MLQPAWKEAEIQNHFVSLYKYFSDKEIKSFTGKSGNKNWHLFQESFEEQLKAIHRIQPIALVVANLTHSFKSTKYGSWHLWTVLDQGPDLLWPLIYSLWKSKPPKGIMDSTASFSKLPEKIEKSKSNQIDEAYGEDWEAETSGNGIKEQMWMQLGAAVKFWEFEVGQLAEKNKNQALKKLSPGQKKFIKLIKKYYPIWI